MNIEKNLAQACDELHATCPHCARLTRELAEARKEIKSNNKLFEKFSNDMANLCTESITARAHFRRACELLEKRAGVKDAGAWQRQIVAEEGKP